MISSLEDLEDLLTPEEAAIFLRVKPKTIKKWLRSGKLKGSKLGGDLSGAWRTTKRDCLDLYNRGKNY
jgi:excisionase family DNA binding protein